MKSIEGLVLKSEHIAGVAIAALALAACASIPREEMVSELSPIKRVDYEFGGDRVLYKGEKFTSGNRCLFNTAYDPVTSRTAADFDISETEDGNIIVTLYANGTGGSIAIRGFEGSGPLYAADEESQVKMDALGCFEN